jgi:hypothetical protein
MLDAAKVASGYSIGRNVSIHAEILKEGVNLAKYHFSESTFRKKQLFDVSGIPHLDHALFRKAEFLNRG